ncbi:MAG: hypothetical protein WCE69_08490 [Aestuariivirga sp.]
MSDLPEVVHRPYNDPMIGKLLGFLLRAGLAVVTSATLAIAEDGMAVPRETRGMIMGTMDHLKGVKLREAPAIPAYVVNTGNVERTDPETAKFILGILSSNQLDMWSH